MNYENIHNQLIHKAKARVLEGYKELHHIVPKCMGGGNEDSNLVYLTAREHFIIHLLLVKMHPSNLKLVRAAFMMATIKSTHQYTRNYTVSSRLYEWLRIEKSSLMKGSTPWNKGKRGMMPTPWNKGKRGEYGWKLSDESKHNQSLAKRGVKLSNSHRLALSVAHMGQLRTLESKAKQSATIKNSIPKICPHCSYSQRGNGIYRYHFSNCKQKLA